MGRSTATEDTTFCDVDDAYVDLDIEMDVVVEESSSDVEGGTGPGGANRHGPMFVTSAAFNDDDDDDSSSDDSIHGGNISSSSWSWSSYHDTNNVFGDDHMDVEEEAATRPSFDPRRLFLPTTNRGGGFPSSNASPRSSSAFTKSSSSSSSSTLHNSSHSTSPKGFPLPTNYGLHEESFHEETTGSHDNYQVSSSTVKKTPPLPLHLQISYLLLVLQILPHCTNHNIIPLLSIKTTITTATFNTTTNVFTTLDRHHLPRSPRLRFL